MKLTPPPKKKTPPPLKEREKYVKMLYYSQITSSFVIICFDTCTYGRKANRVIETHLHQTPE